MTDARGRWAPGLIQQIKAGRDNVVGWVRRNFSVGWRRIEPTWFCLWARPLVCYARHLPNPGDVSLNHRLDEIDLVFRLFRVRWWDGKRTKSPWFRYSIGFTFTARKNW